MILSTHLNPHFNALGHSGRASSVGFYLVNTYKKVRFSARLDSKEDLKDQIQKVTKENKNNKIKGLSPLIKLLTGISLGLGGVGGGLGLLVHKGQVERINQAVVQESKLTQKKAQAIRQLAWLEKQVNVEPEAKIIFDESKREYYKELVSIQDELGSVYNKNLKEHITFNLIVIPVAETSFAIGILLASLLGMQSRRIKKREGALILKRPDLGTWDDEKLNNYKIQIPYYCGVLSELRLKAIQQDADLAALMKSFYSPEELMTEKIQPKKLQSLYEALVYLEHSNPDENIEMGMEKFYRQVCSKVQHPNDKTLFPEIELLERAFIQTPTPDWEAIEKNCFQTPLDSQTLQQLDDAVAYLKNKQILNQLKRCNFKIPFSRTIYYGEVMPEREEDKQARIKKLEAAEKEYTESEVFRSRFVQLHQMLHTLHDIPTDNLSSGQRFKELTVLETLLAEEQDNPILKSLLLESK